MKLPTLGAVVNSLIVVGLLFLVAGLGIEIIYYIVLPHPLVKVPSPAIANIDTCLDIEQLRKLSKVAIRSYVGIAQQANTVLDSGVELASTLAVVAASVILATALYLRRLLKSDGAL